MLNCDLLLINGVVIDGSGRARREASVAVKDGRIVGVGQALNYAAAKTIDLKGLAIAPGFIDVHTHDDRLLLADPSMAAKVSQGATTVITGNCGLSLAPLGQTEAIAPINLIANGPSQRYETFAEYFAALEKNPPAVNMAALLGHTTLRAVTMSDLTRPATEAEIAKMQVLVQEALDAGVVGVSTGLFYAPAQAATAAEIQAVFEPLRGGTALIASHIRNEAAQVLEAMTEAMSIAKELGVRQVLSHHKVNGQENFGRSRETLALVDEMRAQGDVCLDCYPYVASSTVLRQDTVEQASRTLIAWSKAKPETSGRYVDELLKEQDLPLTEFLASLQPAGAIYFSMDEDDVERILAYPDTMIGSDGLPHDERPHPRLWGAFARVLGHYARDENLFSLPQAIHKMTGLSAKRFGIQDRGVIQQGAYADLVLLDPLRIKDTATYDNPLQMCEGIERVMLNGVWSFAQGQCTGQSAGQFLKRQKAH